MIKFRNAGDRRHYRYLYNLNDQQFELWLYAPSDNPQYEHKRDLIFKIPDGSEIDPLFSEILVGLTKRGRRVTLTFEGGRAGYTESYDVIPLCPGSEAVVTALQNYMTGKEALHDFRLKFVREEEF